ncbi:MAG: glycosyltransferase family 9 protein [Castellaniella sp.]
MPDLPAIYLRLPNWVGDACMSLPALEIVLNTGVPVVVCARPWAKDLLAGYPLSAFVPLSGGWRQDRARIRHHHRSHGHAGARGILLPDSLSSALAFRLAGIASAGHRDDGRSLLLRWPIAKSAEPLHAVQAWHRLAGLALQGWQYRVHPAGVPETLGLRLTDDARAACDRVMTHAGITPGRFMLIAPTAVGRHHGRDKVWPEFDALVRDMQADGHTVVMCPPPAEQLQARRNAPTALCLPPLGLTAFATLAANAALVVCNDSGVSHLAAAAGARQITLFGVTDRRRTGPWSPLAHCLGSAQAWPSRDEVRQAIRDILGQDGTHVTAWNYPDT